MKQCATCQQSYPNEYTLCPRDGAALVETSLWSEGTVINGKYRIISKVGKGGMGAVYKALHLRFNELRALKVMNAELVRDATFVRRFEREAVLTRRLQHPNIVRVDDIDEAEDGCPFIVMEYIEGRSLHDLIRAEAPLPAPRVAAIIKQVAAALDAAHQLGMVHRDIKPDNIVLVSTPSGDQAKVLDFGIAKLREEAAGEGAVRTATGTVLGTPQYMSPEQAKGMRGDELDGRSDLYSLGVVMYQMLTGRLPFTAETPAGWILAHLQTPPAPLGATDSSLEISGALADLVIRLLEKDREGRPPSGTALIAQIEQAEMDTRAGLGGTLAGVTVAGTSEGWHPAGTTQQEARKVALNRFTTTLAALRRWRTRALIVSLATVAIIVWTAHTQLERSVLRTVPPSAPTSQPTLVDRMHRFWNLKSTGRDKEAGDELQMARKLNPNLESDLRSALQLQPQDAELHFCLAFVLGTKQPAQVVEELQKGLQLRPKDAFAHLELSIFLLNDDRLREINEAIRLKPDLAQAYWLRAHYLCEKGDLKGATADGLTAMRLNPKVDSSSLIHNLEFKGDLNGALAVAREAARADPTNPLTHHQLASELSRERDWGGAIAEYLEAIRLKPDDALEHARLGFAFQTIGDINGAVAEYREAVHLEPNAPTYHLDLATGLMARGDQFEAAQQEAIAKELSGKSTGQAKRPRP